MRRLTADNYNTHNSKQPEDTDRQSRDAASHAPLLCAGCQNTNCSVIICLRRRRSNTEGTAPYYQHFTLYTPLNSDDTTANINYEYE